MVRVFASRSLFAAVASASIAPLLLSLVELFHRALRAPVDGGFGLLLFPWVGLGIVFPFAIPCGLLQSVVWLAVSRALEGRLSRLFESGPGDADEHTSMRAKLTRAVPSFAVLLAGTWFGSKLIERIQDDTLRRVAWLALVSAGVGAGVVAALLLRRPFHVWWRRAMRTSKQTATWSWQRAAVVCVVPCVAATALLLEYGDVLGVALVPTALVAVLSAQLPFGLLIAESRWQERRRVVLATALAAVVSTPFLLDSSSAVSRALGRQLVAGAALNVLRGVTDFDGDGVSGTYGGGDCRPRDPAIFFGQRPEVPGNGIDEDCDGRDASAAVVLEERYSDSLGPERVRRYNILWILVDAMRADRMSVFGAERKTTPFLEEFGRSSLVFESAYAQATTTHLSIPSTFAGRDVLALRWQRGKDRSRVQLQKSERTLAEVLSDNGYETRAILGDHVSRMASITRGFGKVVHSPTDAGATAVNKHAKSFLSARSKSKKPFFLLAYYPDPHKPYHTARDGFGRDDVDLYDGELRHVDRSIQRLLQQVRSRGLADDTLVVVSSDHGEEFKEHGKTGHGANCHRETTHVPLILHVPGLEPARVGNVVGLVDIVPTLLELTGLRDELPLDGQSLLIPASGGGPERRMVTCLATKQGSTRGTNYFVVGSRQPGLFVQEERVAGIIEVFDTAHDPLEREDLWDTLKDSAEFQRLRDFSSSQEKGNLWQILRD